MLRTYIRIAVFCLALVAVGTGSSKAQETKHLVVEAGIKFSEFSGFDRGDKIKLVLDGDVFKIHDGLLERARLHVVKVTDTSGSVSIIAKFKSGKLNAGGFPVKDLTCGFNLHDFNCEATDIINGKSLRGDVISFEVVKK